MLLAETVNFMVSTDYKERFKAQYLQLEIRVNGVAYNPQNYVYKGK